MKKLLVAFLLFACVIPSSAFEVLRPKSGFLYEPIRIVPVAQRLTDFRKSCPSTMICTRFSGNAILKEQVTLHALTGYYAGIPFDRSAVFCRMENHFLTRYSFKFSIHAGGYREVGSCN